MPYVGEPLNIHKKGWNVRSLQKSNKLPLNWDQNELVQLREEGFPFFSLINMSSCILWSLLLRVNRYFGRRIRLYGICLQQSIDATCMQLALTCARDRLPNQDSSFPCGQSVLYQRLLIRAVISYQGDPLLQPNVKELSDVKQWQHKLLAACSIEFQRYGHGGCYFEDLTGLTL